jgi:hypothetical protein
MSLLFGRLWNSTFVALNLSFLIKFYPHTTEQPVDTFGRSTAFDTDVRACEKGVVVYLIGQLTLYLLYSLPQKPLQFYVDHYRSDWKGSAGLTAIWNLWSLMTVFDLGLSSINTVFPLLNDILKPHHLRISLVSDGTEHGVSKSCMQRKRSRTVLAGHNTNQ